MSNKVALDLQKLTRGSGSKRSSDGPSAKQNRDDQKRSGGGNALVQQSHGSQKSITTERGSSGSGGVRSGEKKPKHAFSDRMPTSRSFSLDKWEFQDRSNDPWAPVWSFKK